MSEYLEIPSRTMVNGQYVDNSAYYTKHQLLGIQPRYQMERDEGKAFRPNLDACLSIDLNHGVEDLLQKTRSRVAYFYDQQAGMLCNTGPITPDDYLKIRQAATDKETLLRAEEWFARDISRVLSGRSVNTQQRNWILSLITGLPWISAEEELGAASPQFCACSNQRIYSRQKATGYLPAVWMAQYGGDQPLAGMAGWSHL